MIRVFVILLIGMPALAAQPPGAQPPGVQRGAQPRGAGRGDDAFTERLMLLDKNEDGGLSKDELPDHMQQHFASSDTDKSGKLTGGEVKTLAAHFSRNRLAPESARANAPNGPGAGRGGPGAGRGGPGAGRGGPGGPGAGGGRGGPGAGGPGAGARGPAAGARGPGAGARGPGAGGRGGPAARGGMDAGQIVELALTFDADEDGQLSREELAKFAAELVARRPAGRGGAQGGPGRGLPGRGQAPSGRPARPVPED